MEEQNLKLSTLSSSEQRSGIPKSSSTADTHINRVFKTSSRSSQIRILENFIIIWLDSNIDDSDEDTRNITIYLQSIVSSIKRFTDSDECVDFLTDIEDEKVFMVVSDYFGQEILPLIVDIPQLHSIYVLCNHQAEHEQWTHESKKVKGVFTQVEPIYDALKQNVRRSDIDLTPISIIPITASTNLDELDPSFMYSQLLKEIIVDIEHDENAKKQFVTFCRQQYVDNDAMLKTIDEFEQNYDRSMSIWWYTKEPFIYSVLNKALRTHDIETIIRMGFFVRDLHRQIQQLHSEMHQSAKMVLYRGQGLLNVDFIKIKNSKGGLLSFSNFLSTSIEPQVSLVFADSVRVDPELTAILFKMEVDPSMSSTPFAPLNNISYYSDSEMEILFSMHTVFRIGDVEQIEDRLWQVNLVLTSDTDQQLKCLGDYMRNELGGKTVWHRMLNLMGRMDKYEICIEACKRLLDATPEYGLENFATLLTDTLKYAAVGYFLQAHCKNAPFEIIPEIQQKSIAPNQPELSTSYQSLGSACDWMEDCKIALSYYEKILEIQEKFLPPNHPKLVITYHSIGGMHQYMGDYSTALSYFEKILEIQQKSLSHDHPDLGSTYDEIGTIHKLMGDYSSALLFYKKTLEIRQKSLPFNHPDLATAYYSIAEMHKSMGDDSTALSYFKEALEIRLRSLPPDHPDLFMTNFQKEWCQLWMEFKELGVMDEEGGGDGEDEG